MSMVARYYTSVTWLGKQADELVVLVTCGLSGTSSNYSATQGWFMISDINDDSKDANKNKMIFMIKRVEDVLDQKSGSCCLIVLMQKRTRRMFIYVHDQDAEHGTVAAELTVQHSRY